MSPVGKLKAKDVINWKKKNTDLNGAEYFNRFSTRNEVAKWICCLLLGGLLCETKTDKSSTCDIDLMHLEILKTNFKDISEQLVVRIDTGLCWRQKPC